MIRSYLYRCPKGHERNRRHPIKWEAATICVCGLEMHRVPQLVRINWNGLAPSAGGLGPAAKTLLDTAYQAQKREAYAAKKAARGETWP